MATFSWSMSLIKRSEGRSVVAAAAYYARDTLHDKRTDKTHDYRDRGDLVHSEILVPDDAPGWCRVLDREQLWNAVEGVEKRKDAQLGRALRVMIPRELDEPDRIALVRDYVRASFTDKGMIADVSFHCPAASDGGQNPHAHILLTLRTLGPSGFGPKCRHDMVPDPEGRTHADGQPVLVESNPNSWNSPAFFERAREAWECSANAALARAGSDQRIDRRSLLERGLARLPEPALRLAFHLKELRGVMVARWGQFQAARHYKAVEGRAQSAFLIEEPGLAERAAARAEAGPASPSPSPSRRDATPAQRAERFLGWIERQIARLAGGAPALAPGHGQSHAQIHDAPATQRAPTHHPPPPDMER